MSSSYMTKRALGNSLKAVLLELPFHKVTVKRIVDHLGVNRQTFYYYFQDIQQLMTWTLKEEIQQSLSDDVFFENWRLGLLRILFYIQQNEQLCRTIFASTGRGAYEKAIYEIAYELFWKAEELDFQDRDFDVNVLAVTFQGLVDQWLEQGLEEEPKQVLDQACRAVSAYCPAKAGANGLAV